MGKVRCLEKVKHEFSHFKNNCTYEKLPKYRLILQNLYNFFFNKHLLLKAILKFQMPECSQNIVATPFLRLF